MPGRTLSHHECVKRARSPERYHRARLSIDGREPERYGCFVLDDGDLLVPTGPDRSLVRAASGRPVVVTISQPGRGEPGWTITGMGLARPLVPADRPRPVPHTTGALAGRFANGIRIVMARLTGWEELPAPRIPPQREPPAQSPAVRPQ
ncbi:hypothetical protein FPZ12_025145 [Amycolatopsis acidicola]|uniref:Pyridoxamine 5'-phosphate oxidase family protein n=1 Tax=Amycolatopsis acidicola TaxID=2596893 RepID=A0A5N0UXX8_9PSEU|nr:hypothetical protein [Amycolatopsis acidicola]KAA9157460.1 hypothetical protein FPZ12_025145 [Amycolatopsis acidicola]